MWLMYDEKNQPIKSTYAENIVLPVIDIPSNAKSIRVTYFVSDVNEIQLEDGTQHTDYEPFKYVVSDEYDTLNRPAIEKINSMIGTKSSNILYGKKWCPFGDSFTEWTTEVIQNGKYKGEYKTYPFIIALRNGIEIDKRFFRSGRTMAYPSDHTFTNSATCPSCDGYYQNIPEDADYITIMLGINDVNHANGSGVTPDGEDATGVITLGTVDDTTTETYCGAYNTVLSWLRENRPFAHVGIIVTNGTTREDYTNAQIALAKKWGYPYINLNGDERTPAMIRCWNSNMSEELKTKLAMIQGADYPSNTHPNAKAHEYESTFIEAWMRTL